MAIPNQLRLYGQLMVDFANAGSTDEAGHKYFENLQKAFGFSPQFTDRAKENFPTVTAFNALLNDTEKNCFDLVLKKTDIELELLSALNGEFLEYNIDSKSFHILKSQIARSKDGSWPDYGNSIEEVLSPVELERIIMSDCTDPGYKARQKKAPKLIAALNAIGKKIQKSKGISDERYKELSTFVPTYRNMMVEHYHIEKCQKELNLLLDQIAQNGSLSNNSVFDELLTTYNIIPKSEAFLSHDGSIARVKPFREDLFLNRGNFPLDSELVYDGPISYCVIEFFEEIDSIKLTKKCADCSNLYLQARDNPRQKYCSVCSKKTHVKREEQLIRTQVSRAKKKKRERRLLYNEQYKRLIQSGYSVEQAQKEAKDYVIEQMPVIE